MWRIRPLLDAEFETGRRIKTMGSEGGYSAATNMEAKLYIVA